MRLRRRDVGPSVGALALLVSLFLAGSGPPSCGPVPVQSGDGETGAIGECDGAVPLIMLLVDTSGSMEYVPDPDDGPGLPVPTCVVSHDGATSEETNGWRIVTEALTGTMVDARCKYDYRRDPDRVDFAYPVPHVRWSARERLRDGFLALHGGAAAFGVATFDSTAWSNRDVQGGFSYYLDEPEGTLGNHSIDLGIANEQADGGALVLPCTDESVLGREGTAAAIEDQILAAIPHFGTPTGCALHDLHTLLSRDPRLLEPALEGAPGDAFASCRPRSVLLITDGRPNPDGQYGYRNAPDAAAHLRETLGVRTWVVHLYRPTAQQLDLRAADASAAAGGTEAFHLPFERDALQGALVEILRHETARARAAGCGCAAD